MIAKEHLKIRLRKFLEDKSLGPHAGLCAYLVRGLEDPGIDYHTWNFLRDWFEPYRKPGTFYVNRMYSVTPLRLQLAQKLLQELEDADSPNINED